MTTGEDLQRISLIIQGRVGKEHGNGFGVGMQGMVEKGKRGML